MTVLLRVKVRLCSHAEKHRPSRKKSPVLERLGSDAFMQAKRKSNEPQGHGRVLLNIRLTLIMPELIDGALRWINQAPLSARRARGARGHWLRAIPVR